MSKILVACEFTQTLTEQLRINGHEAYSCDLIDCEKNPDWHLKCDVKELLQEDWDLIVAHPPCQHLASSGAVWWKEKQADGRQASAIDFVKEIYYSKCPRIAIENPRGILSTVWRKPDQIINPFQFGEPIKKLTCLWLKGLNPLIPTDVVEPLYHWGSNSHRSGPKKDGSRSKPNLTNLSKSSGKDRSRSFSGIAAAMAEQWAGHCL
jgi:hypothetical protein